MLLQTHSPACRLNLFPQFLHFWNRIRLALLGATKEIQQIPFLLTSSSRILPAIVMSQAFYLKSHTYGLLRNIKDVQNGAILSYCLSNRPGHLLEAASTGAVALTNAFRLLCRGTVDCIVLGSISYLMQCNWGDKINQGGDTVLDLKDESSSWAVAECIFQRSWPQEVIEVKSLSNQTDLSRAREQVSRVRLVSFKWLS